MALTTRTREELIRQALEEIEQLGTGMPLEEDDQEAVDDYIDPLLSRLATLGLSIGIPGDQTFDILVFTPLAKLLAADAAPKFGVTYEMLLQKRLVDPPPSVSSSPERELRRLLMGRATGEAMSTEWF